MLLSLPATLLIGFLAVVFFHVPFTGLSVLILFLSAYAMAGFGALIGFYSPTAQVASLLTELLSRLSPQGLAGMPRISMRGDAPFGVSRGSGSRAKSGTWPMTL